jgi:hypothetical protein
MKPRCLLGKADLGKAESLDFLFENTCLRGLADDIPHLNQCFLKTRVIESDLINRWFLPKLPMKEA